MEVEGRENTEGALSCEYVRYTFPFVSHSSLSLADRTEY